jgi:hypothetical protein
MTVKSFIALTPGELCGHGGDGHVLLAAGQQVNGDVTKSVFDGVNAEKNTSPL